MVSLIGIDSAALAQWWCLRLDASIGLLGGGGFIYMLYQIAIGKTAIQFRRKEKKSC